MPVDPTRTVPETDRLPTERVDIGHVAPDFDARRHFNALVVRPELRISLRLGDIDALCPEEPATPAGRRRRLQLLSYFYRPLDDANVATAGNDVWTWFNGAAPNGLGLNDDDIQNLLRTQIVEDGELPPPGEFRKVFLPGGFCYRNADSGAALRGTISGGEHPKFTAEKAMWAKNSVLGAIPIIALVERRNSEDNTWSPAPNITVYLQLHEPEAIPVAQQPPALRNGTSSFTPAPASSPKQYVDQRITDPDGAHPQAAGDPQVDNAHQHVGGKRGNDGADNVLETQMTENGARQFRPGLYLAHGGRAIDGMPPFFNEPEVASGTANTIRAQTNANGEAGYIFAPSRMGGDRYKLRAFVGSPSRPSNGEDVRAVRVDTGTFVVWRRIRFSQHLFWNYPPGTPVASTSSNATWRSRMARRIRGPLPAIDYGGAMANEFRRGFQDVLLETTAGRRAITAAEWQAARNFAIAQLAAGDPNTNYNVLFPSTNTTASIFNPVNAATYGTNRNTGGGAFPALPGGNAYWSRMSTAVSGFKNHFMRHLSKDALPFVLVHAPFGDSLTYHSGPVPAAVRSSRMLTTSGVATAFRGAFVFWGSTVYANWTYPNPCPNAIAGASANAAHESGHCHYGPHHWTSRNSGTGALSGGFPADHDNSDYCVMGYIAMEGDFCGRCILKHRGWNTANITP